MTGSDGITPWYRSWFGESYLALYPHRDEDEAAQAVALFLEAVGPVPGQVLDLACGAGRHLRALRARGVRAMGMDLSMPLLREGGRRDASAPRVRGDMRHLPFREGAFQGVTSFFTSFGYFEAEDEDLGVLREVGRVLQPGGWALLDFLNAEQVRATLEPRDVRMVGRRRVEQLRRLVDGGRRVEKRIRVLDEATGSEERFRERVRLYESHELKHLLGRAGFQVVARHGDYDGRPPAPDAPRQILVARHLPLPASPPGCTP
jgi:SAM-dependent methyltransferase